MNNRYMPRCCCCDRTAVELEEAKSKIRTNQSLILASAAAIVSLGIINHKLRKATDVSKTATEMRIKELKENNAALQAKLFRNIEPEPEPNFCEVEDTNDGSN